MGQLVEGDVVVVPFPFLDLTEAKRRPAIVLATLEGDDMILCMVTSKKVRGRYAVPIATEDFESGGLDIESNARPSRLFTADRRIILRTAARIKKETLNIVLERVRSFFEKR